jgi:hypothetical protein
MKTKWHSSAALIGLIIALALFSDFTCSESEEDQCDATKMVETKKPVIYLKLEIKPFFIDNQYSHYAEAFAISGYITKYYCPHEKSGQFAYTEAIAPKDYDPQYLEQGFYLDQPYEFKFENDLDYLELRYNYNISWVSSKYYMGDETLTVYYKDLIYDYNLNSYYIPIYITELSFGNE